MPLPGEDEAMTVIKELQREVERQADLIYQLRQDNVDLRSKLESEKEVSKRYADELQRALKGPFGQASFAQSDLDIDPALSMSPRESGCCSTMNNALSLTIRTQLQPSASEGSWFDDSGSISCSDLESGSKRFTDSEDVMTDAKTSGIYPKRGAFFRLGKNKMHRKTSLRQSLHKSQQLELCDMIERDETTTLSLTPNRNRRPIPVQHTPEGQRAESLSRLGWTVEAGQKLTLVQDSYAKHRDVFDDDVRFMYEVLKGQSRAPEMDIDVELHKMMKDFKTWRKQFEESVKCLQSTLKKRNNNATISTSCTSSTKHHEGSGVSRRSTVAASIGKLFTRTTTEELQCQERTLSVSQ